MAWHRWQRRSLATLTYLAAWFIATVAAIGLGDAPGAFVAALGAVGPFIYWEWRLLGRVNCRDPERIMKRLQQGQARVELRLSSGMSSAWDPTQGLYGQVSGPGVVTYSLVNDSTVHFTYKGRWGERDVTTSVPPMLIPGTPEAIRAAAAGRQITIALLIFPVGLPTVFAISYFVRVGSRSARVGHAFIAVLLLIVVFVVGSRVLSAVLAARRRKSGTAPGELP